MARPSRVSEGSCSFCRKRRLRCDLTQPKCSRCTDSKQDCVYGPQVRLRWVGGMAMRGRFASSSPASISSVSQSQHSPPRCYSLGSCPSAPAITAPELLLYFNNAVLPRFQIPDEPVEIDFNAVMQDRALRQAILAVAQAHYTMNSKVVSSDSVALQNHARQSAIESFRQLLQQGVTNEATAHQLFSINVLLCMLDGIIEPNEQANASICHLKGGFAILSRWTNTSTRMLLRNGLQAHLLSVFATMDLVHAMLNGDRPYFESVTWHMFANAQTWFGTLTADDNFLAILKAYSEMACLGHVVYSQLPAKDNLMLVERCLSGIEPALKHEASHLGFVQPERASQNNDWSVFCSIYQLAGVIYLERALRLRTINDEAVQAATQQGVEMLVDDVLPSMLSHCLIFPILVIGSHCIHSQDRKAVLEALSPSSSYLSFGSLRLMISFLQNLWRVTGTNATWWECFEPVSEVAFLF